MDAAILTRKSPIDWLTCRTRSCSFIASTLLVKNRLIMPRHLMCCASSATRPQRLKSIRIRGQREGRVYSPAQRIDALLHVVRQMPVLHKQFLKRILECSDARSEGFHALHVRLHGLTSCSQWASLGSRGSRRTWIFLSNSSSACSPLLSPGIPASPADAAAIVNASCNI